MRVFILPCIQKILRKLQKNRFSEYAPQLLGIEHKLLQSLEGRTIIALLPADEEELMPIYFIQTSDSNDGIRCGSCRDLRNNIIEELYVLNPVDDIFISEPSGERFYRGSYYGGSLRSMGVRFSGAQVVVTPTTK